MAEARVGNNSTDEDGGQLRQPVESLRRVVPGFGEVFAARFARRRRGVSRRQVGNRREALDPAGGGGGDSPQPQGCRFRRAGP